MKPSVIKTVRRLKEKWHDQYIVAGASNPQACVRKELLFAKVQAANEIIRELQSAATAAIPPSEPPDSGSMVGQST